MKQVERLSGPKGRSGRIHRVAILTPANTVSLEVAGLIEVLDRANELVPGQAVLPRYEYLVASSQKDKIIRCRSGLRILADAYVGDLDPRTPFGTVLVTGGEPEELLEEKALIDWVKIAYRRAGRVASVCSGVFILAEAGILAGRKATTHWKCSAFFRRLYPDVEVDPDPIFVQDGKIFTSAGVNSGLDLALAFVENDLGRDVALEIARSMILYLKRPGSQSQFSSALRRQISETGPIGTIQAWVLDHLGEDLRVERLASEAAMSPRNFARVFRNEVGITPARFVEELRLDAARQRLVDGDETVERIAADCGFGTSATMRRIFGRRLRVSPQEYRARFKTSKSPVEARA